LGWILGADRTQAGGVIKFHYWSPLRYFKGIFLNDDIFYTLAKLVSEKRFTTSVVNRKKEPL
jgi:chromosome condensin MukBEF MukE localization factor